ncbi:hypothetical protein AB6C54_01880 [Vibrio splendidus]
MGISSICEELNALSKDYKIGQLQRLRKKIKRLSKPKTLKLFSDQTIADEWAFHSGGRTELQFNVGYESRGFRYGVALSLQLSQTLPDISEFEIKIQRFNEFLLAHYSELKHFDITFVACSGTRILSKPQNKKTIKMPTLSSNRLVANFV